MTNSPPASSAAPRELPLPPQGGSGLAMVALLCGIFFLLASLPLGVFVVFEADARCHPRLEMPNPPCDFVAAHFVGGLGVASSGLPALVLGRMARRSLDPQLPVGRRRMRAAQILGALTVLSPVVVIGGIRLLLWLLFRNGLV